MGRHHLGDRRGDHVPQPLVVSPVGRSHAPEENRRRNGQDAVQRAGSFCNVHEQLAAQRHQQEPADAQGQEKPDRNGMNLLDVPVPPPDRLLRHHLGNGGGQPGGGKGVNHSEHAVRGGEIPHPFPVQDVPQGNFENRSEELDEDHGHRQDGHALEHALALAVLQIQHSHSGPGKPPRPLYA